MSTLNERQLSWLRGRIGATPDDLALHQKFDRLGSVRDVALEVLRARLHALLASPLSVNIPGAVSMNNAENVKALERQIAELEKLVDDPSLPTPVPADDRGELGTFALARTRRR
ncbi:hypothetical protein [Aeromicrobium sp. Leaf291]|uniref:hypothetical protein n=1 Tax=Aeromicrobium sp. Leaf291 TaxID=1736325 RepID=UPI0006F8D24B|nr:hypothetical protein [Aeromicrobium sp. Leaf291]KQP81578.1 hypothetical protein ASF35_16235 [Aeromicrobium sp. Leaf291]